MKKRSDRKRIWLWKARIFLILAFCLRPAISTGQQATKAFFKLKVADGRVIEVSSQDSLSSVRSRAVRRPMVEDPNWDPNKVRRTSAFEEPPARRDSIQIQKGEILPATISPHREIFDKYGIYRIQHVDTDDKKMNSIKNFPSSVSSQGWQTIITEGFEGVFPDASWTAYAQSGYTNAYWDDTNSKSHIGSWSAWCADGGTQAGPYGGEYQPNMRSWMIYGPFNLGDATDGKMQFYYWNISDNRKSSIHKN